jgi:hypothetical protein
MYKHNRDVLAINSEVNFFTSSIFLPVIAITRQISSQTKEGIKFLLDKLIKPPPCFIAHHDAMLEMSLSS